MTDFAVLRAPSQVLFGAGMAAAAGRVAADHGRRVLVITDPVDRGTPGFATVARIARPTSTSRSSPRPPSTSRAPRSTPPCRWARQTSPT